MSVEERGTKTYLGRYEYPNGSVFLSGRNFTCHDTNSSPDQESRIKPNDISQFSFNNTSRTYFSRWKTSTVWMSRPVWNGSTEFTPAAYYNSPGKAARTVQLDLRTRLLSDIKAQTVSLGIALAQYRQTASLFAQTTDLIRDLFKGKKYVMNRYVLKSWKKSAYHQRLLREIPNPKTALVAGNAYLTYAFGVRQLADDVNGSLEILQDRLTEPVWVGKNVSGVKRDMNTISWTNAYGMQCTRTIAETVVQRLKSQYQLKPHAYNVGRTGVNNYSEVIWDWIPFSWVVDQMIPVGRYLQALDALSATQNFRAYRTEFYKQGGDFWVDGHLSTYNEESLYRSGILTANGFESNIPLPKYEPSTSWHSLANSVSLLLVLRNSPNIENTYLPRI